MVCSLDLNKQPIFILLDSIAIALGVQIRLIAKPKVEPFSEILKWSNSPKPVDNLILSMRLPIQTHSHSKRCAFQSLNDSLSEDLTPPTSMQQFGSRLQSLRFSSWRKSPEMQLIFFPKSSLSNLSFYCWCQIHDFPSIIRPTEATYRICKCDPHQN